MTRTFFHSISIVAAFALAACGGGGSAGTPPATNGSGGGGGNAANVPQTATVGTASAFVTTNGMTLYVFAADRPNVSNCTSASGCTGVWPPYTAPAGTTAPTGFALISRSDGSLQWTENGSPLYTYTGDTAPGQMNGQGINAFGGVWSVARPAGSSGSGGGGNGGGGGYIAP